MSHPHTLPENTAQVSESGFPHNGWELSGEIASKETPLFDGKIIARMPDLGSENFLQHTGDPNSISFWERIGSSIASMIQRTAHPSPDTTKHFLHRFTAIGGVILFCGIGILLLERKEPSIKNTHVITEIVPERFETATHGGGSSGNTDAAFDSVLRFEPEVVAIPSASGERVAAAPPSSNPPQPIDPKLVEPYRNRPTSDSYSPWNIAQQQPERSHNEVAIGETPPSPPPCDTVAMVPMIDMSMPVSPHEQQWLAQSNPLVRPPVDSFDNVRRPAMPPPHPQFLPNSSTLAAQGMHAQYNQYAPGTVPLNVPIPSGASTLPGGLYPQQHPNGMASSVPPPNEFHNVPPTYRRVY